MLAFIKGPLQKLSLKLPSKNHQGRTVAGLKGREFKRWGTFGAHQP